MDFLVTIFYDNWDSSLSYQCSLVFFGSSIRLRYADLTSFTFLATICELTVVIRLS